MLCQITSYQMHALSDHKLSDACSVLITSCRMYALTRSQAVGCMLWPDHKLSDACSVRSVGYMLCPDHELLDTCSVQITNCRLHALSWSRAVGCMLCPDHKLSDACSVQITSCRMHTLSRWWQWWPWRCCPGEISWDWTACQHKQYAEIYWTTGDKTISWD